ncbi:MAG: GNAT family N-acetyltransferase [bacterium]
MLKRDESDIVAKIVSQEAFLVLNNKKPVGYVELDAWPIEAKIENNLLVEIGGLVVDPEYRHRGIGTDLVKEAVQLSQKRFPGRRIITLANKNSFPIFEKAGMEEIEKRYLPEALWSVCPRCKDYDNFPSCHCRGLILAKTIKEPRDSKGFETRSFDCLDLNKLAELYCEIWQEPPWNETFWQLDQVVIDIKQKLELKNFCGLITTAYDPLLWGMDLGKESRYIIKKCVCFSYGYEVTAEELFQISGHREMDYLFESGKVFYLADLATKKDYRQKGLAKKISFKLLRLVEKKKISHVVLRTETQATAARNLYRKLGFKEHGIFDAKHKTRSYWVLNLTH